MAGLVPPCAVSPLKDGPVSLIFISTVIGNSTAIGTSSLDVHRFTGSLELANQLSVGGSNISSNQTKQMVIENYVVFNNLKIIPFD